MLNHGFWQTRYDGDPSIIGRTLSLDGQSFEIIGVPTHQFFGPEVGRTFDAAVPLCAEPRFRGDNTGIGKPDVWFLEVMGRRKPDWTVGRAQAQLEAISPGIFAATVSPRYTPGTATEYTAFTLTATAAGTGAPGMALALCRSPREEAMSAMPQGVGASSRSGISPRCSCRPCCGRAGG